MDQKSTIRESMLVKLKSMDKDDKERRNARILEKIFSDTKFKKATLIMSYVSKSYEVDTWTIIKKALEMGKKVAVPYVLKGDRFIMPSLIVDKEELIKGPYGVYQPHPDNIRAVDLNQLDIVLVPGIAFDKEGNRLGHGKGYYDRFIKKIPYACTIGLAYDFQILEALPVSEEDRPVSSLVCG